MPDNDLVPRHVRPVWRPSCEAMLGGQEPLVVGREIDRALTAVVKEASLPSTEALVRAMRDSLMYSDTARYEEARRRYALESGLTDLGSQVLAQADEMMELHRGDLMGASELDSASRLLVGALRRHAEAGMCGADDVIEQMLAGGATCAAAERRRQACLDAGQYDAVASRVLLGETARMRAPRSRLSRLSQAEILAQEVP